MPIETRSPTANSGDWHDPANAYTDDSNYAYCGDGEGGLEHEYSGYGFAASGTINEVRIDIKGYSGDATKHSIYIDVWDGSTWYQDIAQITSENPCNPHQFDVSTWINTPAKLNAIKVRIVSDGLGAGPGGSRYVRVCWVPVYADWTSGGQVKTASATLSGEGSLAAAAKFTAAGKATLAGTGALAAAAGAVRPASAAMAGTGSLSAKGSYLQLATANLSGAGTLAAAGRRIRSAAGTLSGAGSLAAAAHRSRAASATLAGTGLLAAAAHRIRTAAATLSGTGSLAAAGTVEGGEVKTASATLAGVGTLAGAAHVTRTATATLSGAGSLAAAGRRIRSAKATLAGTGTLAAAARITAIGKATLSGQGTLSAAAVLIVVATATLSGDGALSAKGSFIILGTATLSGEGSLSAAGTVGISSTLLAAQKSAQRLPYIEAQVYDYERGIKRLSWSRLYQGSEPDNHHGIAFDGQGSMHRIRAATDNKLYRQKVTNPGPSSDCSSWQLIANDCQGPCAIAAYGSKIYIFYRKTDDTLRKYYSHNYGQDWSSGELASYAGVLSMAAAWWGTGDIVVCFALKASQVNAITLDSSDQTTTPHTWSDDNHPWLTTYGIGATYNAFLNQCELVIAGKESDSHYNHHDLFRTKFDSTYEFLALESFLMSPDGEDITYEYPDCHLPSSPQPYEIERVMAVEKFTGTTAYTRPLTCHLVKGTTWSDTTFTEPRPFLDIAPTYGLRLHSTGDYWWLSKPDGVWRAARAASSPLVLTTADPAGRIISLQQNVIARPSTEGRGNLTIVLDNSQGQYNVGEGLVPSHINKRAEVALKLGYRTIEGNETLDAGTYWIDSWEYQAVSLPSSSSLRAERSNLSTFTLFCLDGWGLMDRWTARYQMRWNKDDVDPRSVWQVMYQVLARVGIQLTNSPPKPQSSAINNFYPDFVLDPGTGGDAAIRRLLSFVPDRLVFRGQQAFTKDPLSDEESCYSYGAGAADHKVLAGSYAEQVTLSRSRSLGRDESGDRVLEEALDWDQLQLAIDELEQAYDPNLQTTTRAQERADAILRQMSLRAKRGNLVVPTNVAQELLDVVEVTDARCGISAQDYRVLAIATTYELRNARYRQTLTLGAP